MFIKTEDCSRGKQMTIAISLIIRFIAPAFCGWAYASMMPIDGDGVSGKHTLSEESFEQRKAKRLKVEDDFERSPQQVMEQWKIEEDKDNDDLFQKLSSSLFHVLKLSGEGSENSLFNRIADDLTAHNHSALVLVFDSSTENIKLNRWMCEDEKSKDYDKSLQKPSLPISLTLPYQFRFNEQLGWTFYFSKKVFNHDSFRRCLGSFLSDFQQVCHQLRNQGVCPPKGYQHQLCFRLDDTDPDEGVLF